MLLPDEYLPHAAPMVLLSEVLDYSEGTVRTAVKVDRATPFFQTERGVPAHVGIEWMAQTCGVFAGLEAKAAGGPVCLGFLLGTRRYQAFKPYFVEGERVQVQADLILREGGMGVFHCRIQDAAGNELATAQLTVYQPDGGDALAATMG